MLYINFSVYFMYFALYSRILERINDDILQVGWTIMTDNINETGLTSRQVLHVEPLGNLHMSRCWAP